MGRALADGISASQDRGPREYLSYSALCPEGGPRAHTQSPCRTARNHFLSFILPFPCLKYFVTALQTTRMSAVLTVSLASEETGFRKHFRLSLLS